MLDQPRKVVLIVSLFLIGVAQCSDTDSWKTTEAAAAKASKSAQFAEAEKLLAANLKFAETLTAKDPRLPRTLFDLAEVYRAEGRYNEVFPLYERALQLYISLYGQEAPEIADTLEGEAELYKSLNDYAHAESLLLRALGLRQKLLKPGDPDIAQSQNDLGELYTAIGAFEKAEPLLLQALDTRQKSAEPESVDVAQNLESLGILYSKTVAPSRPRIHSARPSAFTARRLAAIILTMPTLWRALH